MKIMLATPAHGGQVCTGYYTSVVKTLLFFKDEYPGIEIDLRLLSLSILPLARNLFASLVLEDRSYTHLLFVDSDMGFSPSLIAKMIAFQKPVVGVIAPRRRFDYKTYFELGRTLDNAVTSKLLGAEYIGANSVVGSPGSDGEKSVEVKDGFVQVTGVGTGIMLIERSVFERIRERYPDQWVANPGKQGEGAGLKGGLLHCFDPERGEDGLYPGEDVAFCRRWVEGCGGEIWANVDEFIVHIGHENFVGQYLFKLQHQHENRQAIAAE
jgi:hypothetical protein